MSTVFTGGLAAFVAALVGTLLTTPVAKAAAFRLGFVDRPSERKVHNQPVPYLGGLAIIISFSLVVVFWAAEDANSSDLNMPAIMGGALTVAAMGLYDDFKVVPGWIKVPVELGLGALLYFSGSQAELFSRGPMDFLLTVAWVIGVTNAVNYVDNMDGLSAGIVAIASAFFWLLAGSSGQFLISGLSAALAGCALGFLWYNRSPARIFMGDAGSLFFGFLLAAFGLELRFDNMARVSFLVPVAIMALPILDALLVSVSRSLRGLSPIHPGKDHLSHRLVNSGLSPVAAVGMLWLGSAICGGIGVLIAYSDPGIAYILMSGMVFAALLAAFVLLRSERGSAEAPF